MILIVLCRENIGYNREGIQELFKMAKTVSGCEPPIVCCVCELTYFVCALLLQVQLREIVECIQEIFLKYNFISKENVQRIYAERDKRSITIDISKQAAIEPLARCKLCTLV
jgi:hypothetical protein